MKRAFFLVHPGSACGSANHNIGKTDARMYREAIVEDLLAVDCDETFVWVTGELDDELRDYGNLDNAVACAAKSAGRYLKVHGYDGAPGAGPASLEAVKQLSLSPAEDEIFVTGAWFNSENDDYGCVNDAVLALRGAGFTVRVLGSAVLEADCEERDDADADLVFVRKDAAPAPAPATTPRRF